MLEGVSAAAPGYRTHRSTCVPPSRRSVGSIRWGPRRNPPGPVRTYRSRRPRCWRQRWRIPARNVAAGLESRGTGSSSDCPPSSASRLPALVAGHGPLWWRRRATPTPWTRTWRSSSLKFYWRVNEVGFSHWWEPVWGMQQLCWVKLVEVCCMFKLEQGGRWVVG